MQVNTIGQNNATLVPATLAGLTVPIGPNQIISCRWHLCMNDLTVQGVSFSLGFPAGIVSKFADGNFNGFDVTSVWQEAMGGYDDNQFVPNVFFSNPTGGFAGRWVGDINALIVNGPNAGVISLKFAQTAASVNPVEIFKGAYVDWTVIR